MSSSITVQRICQNCGKEFTAKKTVTRCCSDVCAKALYKKNLRGMKIEASNKETLAIKTLPLELIKAKEYLTVREVSKLLNCSIRVIYYHIQNGTIKAYNLGRRITRIKRSDIDYLFQRVNAIEQPTIKTELSECYTLSEIKAKFNISDAGLHKLIKRNKIPKSKKGWHTYVPKSIIDNLLNNI